MAALLRMTLVLSVFVGFMVASTGAFFFPQLRLVVAPVLCQDGELVQELPISNKHLNLYCRNEQTELDREIDFWPYLPVATAFYSALVFLPIGILLALAARRAGQSTLVQARQTASSDLPRRTAERLAELERLRQSDLISAEEYQQKRRAILDEL